MWMDHLTEHRPDDPECRCTPCPEWLNPLLEEGAGRRWRFESFNLGRAAERQAPIAMPVAVVAAANRTHEMREASGTTSITNISVFGRQNFGRGAVETRSVSTAIYAFQCTPLITWHLFMLNASSSFFSSYLYNTHTCKHYSISSLDRWNARIM